MKSYKKKLKRLTLFDKLTILFAIIGTIFFAYFFFRKPQYKVAVIKVNEDVIRYESWRLIATNPIGNRVWYSALFRPGLSEKDGLGKITAEIVDVYSYDTAPGRKDIYITTRLNSTYNRATNQYTYKGKPLIAGTQVKINFDGVYVEGLITGVEGQHDPRNKIKLKVSARLKDENQTYFETSGVEPFVADAITGGTEIKDNKGGVVVKIDKVRIEDADRLVTTSDGRVLTQKYPLRKDVYLELTINGLEIDNKYFMFDDVPVTIGERIPLNTPFYSIFPYVTDIMPVNE